MEFKMASLKISYALPVFLTLFLILWTLIVSPYSQYGDDWAILPAILMAPVVLICHLVLIFYNRGKEKKIWFSFYGLVHFSIFIIIWINCLMKISKDSL
jgi:cytochrome bd-type quinol oxidase subunit 2